MRLLGQKVKTLSCSRVRIWGSSVGSPAGDGPGARLHLATSGLFYALCKQRLSSPLAAYSTGRWTVDEMEMRTAFERGLNQHGYAFQYRVIQEALRVGRFHLASAELSGADVFLTVDLPLLRLATRMSGELSVPVADPVHFIEEIYQWKH